jgi:hypothetical protein
MEDNKHLHELREKLQEKFEYHKKQMEQMQENLRSVTTTLELLEGKKPKAEGEPLNFPMELLEGLSQIEALKTIAHYNGGKLKIKTAKRLLIDAGLIKTEGNASNIVNTAIKRSEVFRNVGYGEYELIESADAGKAISIGGTMRQVS